MRKIFITTIFLLATLSVAAQSLNSTVDVTNDYSASFSGAVKSDIPMSVPDTLLQFNKNFDYSTFDNPFKGSYEFTPYSVQLRPDAGYYGDHRFWLCAGAGWPMHPMLKAVYSPALKKAKGVNLSIFQDASGFYGKYTGHEVDYLNVTELFGADFHLAAKKVNFNATAAYEGIFAGNHDSMDITNSAYLNLGLETLKGKVMTFKADIDGRFAKLPSGNTEGSFKIGVTMEPHYKNLFRFPVDFNVQTVPSRSMLAVTFAPHAKLGLGAFALTAGVKLIYKTEAEPLLSNNGIKLTPDVHARLDICKGIVTLYADADGGCDLYSAFDAMKHNHFLATPSAGVVDEAIRLGGGLRGHISSHFQYDLGGGYRIFNSAPLDGPVVMDHWPNATIQNCKFNMIYADGRIMWRSERVDAEAGVHFKQAGLAEDAQAYALPRFSGSARVIYNWQKRIYAGVSCEFATAREGNLQVPAYADLGVYAEYKFTRAFSFWAEGGNLLNQNIQRIPGYSEPGIFGTAGITLNF